MRPWRITSVSISTQLICCTLLSVGLALLLAPSAFAMAGEGSFNYSYFRCSGGKGVGSLFGIFNQCPTELTTGNIFSYLTCNIERLITDLFGDVYCGVIRRLEPAIRAVLTLSVVLFGVGFTVGWIPATARDFLMYLLKITFMYVFATQADYMIGVAYRFFVTGSQEGIAMVVATLFDQQVGIAGVGGYFVNGTNVFAFIDTALGTFFNTITKAVGANPEEGQNPCASAIFAAMGLMLVAFPPIAYMFMLVLAKIVMTFFRSIFGYLFSLVGLAFLMVLSPIFLSFSLFKQTRPMFDKWLGHLVSYSLQMVVVFAFMAFVFSMNVTNMTSNLTDIVVYNKQVVTNSSNTIRMPWEYCTLCNFAMAKMNPTTKEVLLAANDPDANDQNDGVVRARLNGVELGPVQTYLSSEQIDPARTKLVCISPISPLDPQMMVAPENTCPEGQACNPGVGVANSQQIQNTLLTFMMSGLLSLLILAYIIDQMLTYAPLIAQTLSSGMSGSNYAVQIGGGYNPSGRPSVEMPFEGAINTAGGAFSEAYNADSRRNANTFARTGAGLSAGMQAFLFGRDDGGRSQGVVDGMTSWLLNPTRGAEDEDRNLAGGGGLSSARPYIARAAEALRGSDRGALQSALADLEHAMTLTDDPVAMGEIREMIDALNGLGIQRQPLADASAAVDANEGGDSPQDTTSGSGTPGTGGTT